MIVPILLMLAAAPVQPLQPGRWDVRSTIVELAVPGVPGFLQRMAKGRTTSERKVLTTGQGIEELLAPDPKARCRIDSQQIADGRYAQALACPQKQGDPLRISRVGTYDAGGIAGRATVVGTTPKGPIRIVFEQRAARAGG